MTNQKFPPISDERRAFLMRKTFIELMQEELLDEFKNNYPDAYQDKLINGEKTMRLAVALTKTFEENRISGDAEILKELAPSVYDMQFTEHYGYPPSVASQKAV